MFKEIEKYPGYFINESGIVIDSNSNIIRNNYDRFGFCYITINNISERVDKLVAESYLINSNNYGNICHRDGDIFNNHISNLYWSDKPNMYEERKYIEYKGKSKLQYVYEVYNESEVIQCIGREQVANLIQYEIISLKNMIGNGRKISLGPYKGYSIRKLDEKRMV